MTHQNNLDTQPWFKQGWPWALIAIPFLTVVAGVITFIIANDTSDSLVQDDYYKEGLAINSNINRVELARRLSITAELKVDIQTKLLNVKLTSTAKLPAKINISFSHPTLKQNDQSIQLTQLTSNEYVAELAELKAAYWHVSIEDLQKSWLLKGRWLYPDKKELLIDSQLQ